jgi:hypothetical protein
MPEYVPPAGNEPGVWIFWPAHPGERCDVCGKRVYRYHDLRRVGDGAALYCDPCAQAAEARIFTPLHCTAYAEDGGCGREECPRCGPHIIPPEDALEVLQYDGTNDAG